MKIQPPLFWHQGLFLQPQHFQLQDQVAQSRLIPFQQYLQPYFWGVASMEIETAPLGTGMFSLLGGRFLFPDGSFVEVPGNGHVKPRSFAEGWLDGGKPLQVYLGLKKWQEVAPNVTTVTRMEDAVTASTRFVAAIDPEEVRDLHAGGPDGQVKRLRYALKIFWESEREELGDYLLIPLARLEKAGATVRLSPHFTPPCLDLACNAPLARLLREIRDQLASRCHQLEQYKQQRGIQTADFGSRDMVYLLALRTLNRHVPLLCHYLDAAPVHPWTVYGALRQLIGELSSFSLRVNHLGELDGGYRMLPPYDHQAIWDCFHAAQQLISQLLDEITAGPDYILRLEFDGTYYAGELKPSMLEGNCRYYLSLRTAEDPQPVLASLLATAKLSAKEHLPVLASRSLPGLGLESLPVPPQELPRRADTHYFAINHNNEQWERVSRSHSLAMYWNGAPEDLEVELMVVEKTGR